MPGCWHCWLCDHWVGGDMPCSEASVPADFCPFRAYREDQLFGRRLWTGLLSSQVENLARTRWLHPPVYRRRTGLMQNLHQLQKPPGSQRASDQVVGSPNL